MDEINMPGPATLFFLLILCLVGFFYVRLITRYVTGWKKIQYPANISSNQLPPVSVVVPFRNEGKNIAALVMALQNQDYPPGKIEYLFINDHSSDPSAEALGKFSKEDPRISIHTNEGSGKKDALLTGIQHAVHEIILQTDADTLPSSQWIRTMAGSMMGEKVKFVAGPVIMRTRHGFFQHLQALEYMSLTAAGIGAAGNGKPVLCSGANLAYKKSVIIGLPDPFNRKRQSGDDIFLLHQVKKRDASSIRFIKAPSALVGINPMDTLRDFFSQRGRWTGKTIYLSDGDTLSQALYVFLMNMSILVTFFTGIFFPWCWTVTLILYIVKSIPDYILLHTIAKTYGCPERMIYFAPAQIMYPWYVLVSLLSGLIRLFPFMHSSSGKNHWK